MQVDQEIYGVKLSTQFTLFGNVNFCQNYVSVYVLLLLARSFPFAPSFLLLQDVQGFR